MTVRPMPVDHQVGHEQYNPLTLRLYDTLVYGLTCPLFWKVPESALLRLYERNIAETHLDIGVGTGRLLDRCAMPVDRPRITLFDLNPHCLAHAARRLARYEVTTHLGSVLKPFPRLVGSHGSAALNLMLHCVPGDIPEKAIAFDHTAGCVRPGGKIFGSTVLSRGVPVTRRARFALGRLNAVRSFHNTEDDLEDLHEQLEKRFSRYRVTVYGCVALFEATVD
ncbi:class I SAM-dependent methyltransferase [Streptomyces pactum]|uniref:Class I SAM-dependent methyltransferase n=1 Tax=Streptomyces pactum TaxID=68249 RepID=A0ABS0NJH3_9ACTN|nr:class I SAM-dependent methyltransferase [Streptomyces pactum]MBH5335349.1 class I SAM-dependent methyltransferase [Streptomyces pactum]